MKKANVDIGEVRSIKRVAISAAIGGTVAKIGGGKFKNGAASGAFSAMFDENEQKDPEVVEEEIVDEIIGLAKEGVLGFELDGDYTFVKKLDEIITLKLDGNGKLAPASTSADDPARAYGLTHTGELTITLYEGSGKAHYGSPGMNPDDFITDQAPPMGTIGETRAQLPLTAHEHAAYVIGHEANGHVNHSLSWGMSSEQVADYYGWQAVKAYRKYRDSK